MELRLLLACDGKIEEQVLICFLMKKEHREKSERSRADKAERGVEGEDRWPATRRHAA